jgi:hypothetical protein
LNGTSNTSIDLLHMIADGNTAASQAYSSGRVFSTQQNVTSLTYATGSVYIPNYLIGIQKAMGVESAQTWNAVSPRPSMHFAAEKWNNTGAITSITLTPDGGGTFVQYSSAYLYGVSNA